MRRSAMFAAVALIFGLAYVFITPPFEVPDEVGHYWRASSIAYGSLLTPKPPMPRGFRIIVYALWTPDRTQHVTGERLRLARGVMLEPEARVPVGGYSFYSPAAYGPQILAAFISRIALIRPFYGFYVGRLATLIGSIFVVFSACAIAPAFRGHLAAAALLPMTLFLLASWSADAMTIAAAFLTSALILSAFEGTVRMRWIVVASFWLSLCKPSYALLSLLAILIPNKRRADIALLLTATIAGSFLSSWLTMSTATALPRPELPVDSHAQLQYIRDDPARFAGILAHDLRINGLDYLRGMTGRFGLYDVAPPSAVTILLLAMLVAVGVLNGPSLLARVRLAILSIAAAITIAILAYLYLTSSIAGGTTIEGTQGRYLLPILPLVLAVFRVPRLRFSVPYPAILGVAAIANVVCIAVMIQRYW